MQPDLFAGPAQRDDSHRILARLANGGIAPAPTRQWNYWNMTQRARMAGVVALLAIIAATWAWLQDVGTAPQQPPPMQVEASAAAAHVIADRAAPGYPARSQAATIVNEPARAATVAAQPPAQASVHAETHLAHQRIAKAAIPPRGQRNEPPAERDEDVTLLTAMLKHANGQKGASTPPSD